MTDKKKSDQQGKSKLQSRRKSLRNIVMGTGAVGVGASNTQWKKPQIRL